MALTCIDSAVLATETAAGRILLQARGRQMARKDLPAWQAAIRRRAARGERIASSCDLRDPFRFFSLFWPFSKLQNDHCREGYALELRSALGTSFSVTGYGFGWYGEEPTIEVKW